VTAQQARLLAGAESLPLRDRDGELIISVPENAPDAAATVIALY
jgi:hypothetical protein